MKSLKKRFIHLLSFGIFPELEGSKKIAIQIASFDAIASVLAFLACMIQTYNLKFYNLATYHLCAFLLGLVGIFLIRKRHYDSGRILLHYVGLAEIFLSIDGLGLNSGYELYYLTPIIVPFLTFTPKELSKSIFLSVSGLIVLILQNIVGTELFSAHSPTSLTDKIITMSMLFTYIIGLFSISRWQNNTAQEKLLAQQTTIAHINNIAALGIMSGGIAHEINNPLQILSIRVAAIKKQLSQLDPVPTSVSDHVKAMEETIVRIAKIVKGLKNLSRDSTRDIQETFSVKEALDDVMVVCSQKIKDNEIRLDIKIASDLKVNGQLIQFSQVIINLLNNSIDAIEELPQKWIQIELTEKNNIVRLELTDSGPGIPPEVVEQMMMPFFTTKDPGKGTGLGLSISKNIIEKTGGKFYFDSESAHTKFVIEIPTANQQH